jgi:tetratricopeptide (TPR) repeat protein
MHPMSERLSFWEALSLQANALQDQGLTREARQRFEQLLNMPALPEASRVTCHVHLAQLDLSLERYRPARRHLFAALHIDPNHLDAHELMATVFEFDPCSSARRAWKHRLAVAKGEPKVISSWISLAQLAGRLDRGKLASKALRKAEELGFQTLLQLEQVITLWLDLGRIKNARRTLDRNRFSFHKQIGFQRLERTFGYRQTVLKAQHDDRTEATILPFPAVVTLIDTNEEGGEGTIPMIRTHAHSKAKPHLFRTRNHGFDPRRSS